jgi:hypothetical protein
VALAGLLGRLLPALERSLLRSLGPAAMSSLGGEALTSHGDPAARACAASGARFASRGGGLVLMSENSSVGETMRTAFIFRFFAATNIIRKAKFLSRIPRQLAVPAVLR